MKVTIAKVHENLFSGDADSLTLPTTNGEITVLPKHEPFVTNLKPGTIILRTNSGAQKFEIADGVLEVSNNQVTVIL